MSDKKPMVLVFAGPNGSGKVLLLSFLKLSGHIQTLTIWFLQQE